MWGAVINDGLSSGILALSKQDSTIQFGGKFDLVEAGEYTNHRYSRNNLHLRRFQEKVVLFFPGKPQSPLLSTVPPDQQGICDHYPGRGVRFRRCLSRQRLFLPHMYTVLVVEWFPAWISPVPYPKLPEARQKNSSTADSSPSITFIAGSRRLIRERDAGAQSFYTAFVFGKTDRAVQQSNRPRRTNRPMNHL